MKNHNILNWGIVILVITILSLVVIIGCSNTLIDDVLEKIEVDKENAGGIEILSGPQSPSPSDGLSISDVTPQLNWEDITGAAAYHIQVNEAIDFNGVMSIDDNTLTVSQYDVDITECLDNGKTYYWRVQVQNTDNIWGDWSVVWQFIVDINPEIPANPNPSSGSSFIDTTPLLIWDDIPSALTYHIQINTVDDFSGIIIDDIDDLALSQYQFDSYLLDNTAYYWRVRINIEDDIQGDWSDSWSFNIDIPPPAILSPSNTDILSDTTPYYDWDDVTDASGYQIQVNTNSSFSGTMEINESVSTSNFSVIETLSDNTTYYWHVRTKNEDGILGDWSDTWSFSIDIPAPTNLIPTDQSICTDPTPLFSWDDITGSTGYQFQLNTTSDFLGVMLSDENIANFSYFNADSFLSDSVHYFCRVRSKNEDNVWSDWGSINEIIFHKIIQISGSGSTSFALRSDGTVWAWGNDDEGSLGDNVIEENKNIPTPVSGLSDVVTICGNRGTAFAISLPHKTLTGWGNNGYGALGDGTEIDRYTPVPVNIGQDVKQVVGDYTLSAALRVEGSVWTWGLDDEALGDGPVIQNDILIPTEIRGENNEIYNNIIKLASNGSHVLALRNDHTVWAWGYNKYGQLGLGDEISRDYPTQIPGLTDVVDITAGVRHSMALKSDGTVWVWGVSEFGQLGLGEMSETEYRTPVQVLTITDTIIEIDASIRTSLALASDGSVWAWGQNDDGQLGDGTIIDNPNPRKIAVLNNIVAISEGSSHTMALEENGTLWAFGGNYLGELGNGTNVGSAIPVQVEW